MSIRRLKRRERRRRTSHLNDMGPVETLNSAQGGDVLGRDKGDGDSLGTEATAATDAGDSVLTRAGEVVIDDERDLLEIDTRGQELDGDEDAGRSGAELLHDDRTLRVTHSLMNLLVVTRTSD